MKWALALVLIPLAAQDNSGLATLDLAARRAELQSDSEGAQTLLRKCLEASRSASDAAYAQAVVRLASSYSSQGEMNKAQQLVKSEMDRGFHHGSAGWGRLFHLLNATTNVLTPRQAEAAWQRLVALSPPQPSVPEVSTPLAQLRYAEVLAINGKPDEAAVALQEAAKQSRGPASRASAYFRLCTHYTDYGQEQAALDVEWRMLEATYLDPDMVTVSLWQKIAGVWQESGRAAEAAALRNRIQEIAQPPNSEMLKATLASRGSPVPNRIQTPEQLEESRIAMREAAEVYRLEQQHRDAAQAAEASVREWANQAREQIRALQFAQAEDTLGRMLALAEKQPVSNSMRYVDVMGAANEYIMVNQPKRVLAWSERVVAVARRKLPPASLELQLLMERLASTYGDADRLDDAESIYREILHSIETAGGDPVPTLRTLGLMKTAGCKCVDGLVSLRQAVAAAEERGGPQNPILIDPLLALATASDALKVPEAEARAPLERAWEIAQKLPIADIAQQDGRRAEVLASLALHWFERKKLDEVASVRAKAKQVGCEVEFLRRYSLALYFHGDQEESERIGRLYDAAAFAQHPRPPRQP